MATALSDFVNKKENAAIIDTVQDILEKWQDILKKKVDEKEVSIYILNTNKMTNIYNKDVEFDFKEEAAKIKSDIEKAQKKDGNHSNYYSTTDIILNSHMIIKVTAMFVKIDQKKEVKNTILMMMMTMMTMTIQKRVKQRRKQRKRLSQRLLKHLPNRAAKLLHHHQLSRLKKKLQAVVVAVEAKERHLRKVMQKTMMIMTSLLS